MLLLIAMPLPQVFFYDMNAAEVYAKPVTMKISFCSCLAVIFALLILMRHEIKLIIYLLGHMSHLIASRHNSPVLCRLGGVLAGGGKL